MFQENNIENIILFILNLVIICILVDTKLYLDKLVTSVLYVSIHLTLHMKIITHIKDTVSRKYYMYINDLYNCIIIVDK